jgi:hypothetical protein
MVEGLWCRHVLPTKSNIRIQKFDQVNSVYWATCISRGIFGEMRDTQNIFVGILEDLMSYETKVGHAQR